MGVGVGVADLVFAGNAVEADTEDWKREKQIPPGRDCCVLPVSRDRRGVKQLSLSPALEQLRPSGGRRR